jgi:hypothetical protein
VGEGAVAAVRRYGKDTFEIVEASDLKVADLKIRIKCSVRGVLYRLQYYISG